MDLYNTVGFFFFLFWMKAVTGDISDEEMAMFLNICICELQRLNIKQISYIHQEPFWHEKVPLPKANQMCEWDMPILLGVYQLRTTERPQELYIL